MTTKFTVLFGLLALVTTTLAVVTYKPTWESIDARPLPTWYDKVKVGIFLHWGVFSVPSFQSEWFWEEWRSDRHPVYNKFMERNFKPNFTYEQFAPEFTAEFWEPEQWAKLFARSGARYVVLTSKHHEGYTLWPSKYSFNWNAMDVGPKRDLVGELAAAVRKENLTFGLYHSLYEWFNPMYLADKASGYKSNVFVANKIRPEMEELVNAYKPEVIWSDGDWDAPDTYWNSTDFLAWLYNESPVRETAVTNDRWGSGTGCHHGGFFSCADRYNPGTLQVHKWENAMTLDRKSWGYRREATLDDYLSIDELITQLASTVSCGGNILINIGPTKEGTIKPIFEERLVQLGQWLEVNGQAIYETTPWKHQNDTTTAGVWYTQSRVDLINGIVLSRAAPSEVIVFGVIPFEAVVAVQILKHGHQEAIKFAKDATTGGTSVIFPILTPNELRFGYTFQFYLKV